MSDFFDMEEKIMYARGLVNCIEHAAAVDQDGHCAHDRPLVPSFGIMLTARKCGEVLQELAELYNNCPNPGKSANLIDENNLTV
jgi:hypothetical protein